LEISKPWWAEEKGNFEMEGEVTGELIKIYNIGHLREKLIKNAVQNLLSL
jgi:hypothetical protein